MESINNFPSLARRKYSSLSGNSWSGGWNLVSRNDSKVSRSKPFAVNSVTVVFLLITRRAEFHGLARG